MSRLNIFLSVIALLLAVALLLGWDRIASLGNGGKTGDFTDVRALAEAGFAGHDAVPEWLPPTATGIRINRTGSGTDYLFFLFADEDLAALREACPRILQPTPALPDGLDNRWKPAAPDAFYACEKGILAIDGAQRAALLWR
jgi:hypothetical protein